MKGVRVLLIATYELGKQPFGLASPAAFLRAAGHHVDVVDTSVQKVSLATVRQADMVGFHLPMHTATRMAAPMIGTVRAANPAARVVCYGLYAPINEAYLRGLGVTAIVGGEFEAELVRVAGDAAHVPPLVSFERLAFRLPDRSTLPVLSNYAKIDMGDGER